MAHCPVEVAARALVAVLLGGSVAVVLFVIITEPSETSETILLLVAFLMSPTLVAVLSSMPSLTWPHLALGATIGTVMPFGVPLAHSLFDPRQYEWDWSPGFYVTFITFSAFMTWMINITLASLIYFASSTARRRTNRARQEGMDHTAR